MSLDRSQNRERVFRVKRIGTWTLAGFAGIALAVGLLLVLASGLSIYSSRADVPAEIVSLGPDGLTPALHLQPPSPAEPGQAGATGGGAPSASLGTVVVVHGFSGTKEFMRDIDYTLARAGFEVYGLDVPGHGHSGLRLVGVSLTAGRGHAGAGGDSGSGGTTGGSAGPALDEWFTNLLDDMVAKGRLSTGRIYLVGHSLGTLIVTRGALDNPDLGIRGVVALSPVFGDITTTSPANYLALQAEGEIAGVPQTTLKALQAGTGLPDPKFETTYGDYAAGTARAAAVIKGTTHVSIPDAKLAIASTVTWLRLAAGDATKELPRIEGEKAERGFGMLGVGLLLLGLFYSAAGGLGLLGHSPRRPEASAVVEDARVAAGLLARPVMLAPIPGSRAIPVPEVLPEDVRKAKERATQLYAGTRAIPLLHFAAALVAVAVPGFLGGFSFLRQPGADYLAVYLLVFAAVVTPLLIFTGRYIRTGPLVETRTRLGVPTALALGLVAFLALYLGLGGFVTYAWTSVWPPASRLGHILLLAVLFAPFAVVDEIVRASTHDRAGFWWGFLTMVIGKLVFVVSWYLGLFFPVQPLALLLVASILAGVLIALDLVLSLFYSEHGSWPVNAVVKALTLAWFIGAVFPLVG